MKILLSHRYIFPDSSPYATMLRRLGAVMVDAGHDVHLFGSMPSYRKGAAKAARSEVVDAVSVKRCNVFSERSGGPLLRVINVIIYCSALFFHILRLRPDVVTASTFPPVAAGWAASLAAKIIGARMVYHMQDIHPEVSLYSGGRLGRGLPLRVLRWADNQTLRRASAIIVLSQDMADTVTARGLGALPIHVINNFSLDVDTPTEPAPAGLEKTNGMQRAIFAGNLGKFQNLPLLTEGIAKVLPEFPKLELFFLGDGEVEAQLKTRWEGHPQIRFAPFLPFAQAKGLIQDADIGLVSLAPDIFRVSSPSKIETYLDLGLPLLVMAEPHSALARDVVAQGLGEVPDAQSTDGVADALKRLLTGPSRAGAIAAWRAGAGSSKVREHKWVELMADLDESTSRAR